MEISKEDIGLRVKEVRKRLKLTQAELGEVLGKGNKAISAYETGAADLSSADLAKLARLAGVSIDWIVTGQDSSRGNGNGKSLTHINKGTSVYEEAVQYGYVKSEVYLLGGAGIPHELTSQESIDTIFLPQKFLKQSIVPIQIAGRSMEPILFNGAFIGVDREDRKVVTGEIYAVYLPYEGTVVKRIYMSTNHVILKSDNPSFPELSIPIEKIDPDNFIFGRVKWVLQEI